MKQLENRVRIRFQPSPPGVRRPAAVPLLPGVTVPRRSSILKRVVVTGALGSGLAFAGFQLSQMPGTAQDYKTEKVKRGTLIREVIASGPLVPVLKAEVDSLVAGTALAVHADFGSQVEAGQALAQIDPATAKLTLQEAEISLGSARAVVQQTKTLMKEGLLPKTDYDKAVSNARIAESNVSRARIEVERCTVRSPLQGVVITRNVTVGQSVDTGNGTPPLFVVASDLSKMQIEANVAESDIGGVRQGMQANFTVDAFPEETFKGQVVQVRTVPVVDQTVVIYPVLIETANEDLRLKPGMTASVTIVVDHREDVLTIPNKALRFRPADGQDAAARKKSKDKGSKSKDKGSKDGDDGVMKASSSSAEADGKKASTSSVEADGKEAAIVVYRLVPPGPKANGKRPGSLEKVAIKTGASDGKQTEVLEGLDEGDRLVVGLSQKGDEKGGLFSRLPEILSGGSGKKKKGI